MGSSADAFIIYGINLSGIYEWPETLVAEPFSYPYPDFDAFLATLEGPQVYRAEQHGSGQVDEPDYILGIKRTYTKSSWDGPKDITDFLNNPDKLIISAGDIDALREVISKMGLEWPEEGPRWYLCAYWG